MPIHRRRRRGCRRFWLPTVTGQRSEGTSICSDLLGSEQVCDQIEQEKLRQIQEDANTAQKWLAACGFVPGIGEPCDFTDMILAAGLGDYQGAATSGAAMVPFLGWGAGGRRMIDLVREGKKVEKRACRPISFAPGARVLLGNGIQKTRAGETVLASCAGAAAAWARKADFSNQSLLQKKWNAHKADFGSTGNWNAAKRAEFEKLLLDHMTAPGTKIYRFNYRGQGQAVGFIDPATRKMVMLRGDSGKFWTAYKLGDNQFSDIIRKNWLW